MSRLHGRIPQRSNNRQASLVEATYAAVLSLYQRGQLAQALELCRGKLLKLAPRHPGGLVCAGVICYLNKDYPAAERYLQAAAAKGDNADAYTNLALTFAATHRVPEAEQAYRRSLALNPAQANAWNNLGNILKNSFRPERQAEALECYRRAIKADPGYATAYNNLGHALDAIDGNKGAAEQNFRLAIACNPGYLQPQLNLASILEKTGREVEALDCLRQALALHAGNAEITGRILSLRRRLADWDDRQPSIDEFLALLAQGDGGDVSPLDMLAWPEFDAATLRGLASQFGRKRWASALAAAPLVSPVASAHVGRLRIGYLSADFRNHPVAHLITEVIAAHDREHFEAHLYAYGPEVDDEERRRLIAAADNFTVISQMDDLQAAQLIRDDRIDILIDLTGYTTHARLGICALRPAPVIASWIGYVGTLGEPRLADYIISDAVATPPAHAAYFSEALALMPECFQPNCPLTPQADPPARAAENLPADAVVFCSFNQVFKFTPQLWDDWCEILRKVPQGVLWIAPGSAEVIRSNLLKETMARGIDPGRIIFAKRQSLADHRARIALADIALDTYPYNSGATASDALRAGVPLITCMGETFVSRMAGSLLHALGMHELCTTSRPDYISLAIELANDAARRDAIRRKLVERLGTSVLYQSDRFAAQLEQLLQAMHAQARRGQRELIDLSCRGAVAG